MAGSSNDTEGVIVNVLGPNVAGTYNLYISTPAALMAGSFPLEDIEEMHAKLGAEIAKIREVTAP